MYAASLHFVFTPDKYALPSLCLQANSASAGFPKRHQINEVFGEGVFRVELGTAQRKTERISCQTPKIKETGMHLGRY